MRKRNLCSHCQTGKYTYELDKRSTVCPYLYSYDGKQCPMYKELEKKKKRSFLKNIIEKITVSSFR